jgi:hypothetical protein
MDRRLHEVRNKLAVASVLWPAWVIVRAPAFSHVGSSSFYTRTLICRSFSTARYLSVAGAVVCGLGDTGPCLTQPLRTPSPPFRCRPIGLTAPCPQAWLVLPLGAPPPRLYPPGHLGCASLMRPRRRMRRVRQRAGVGAQPRRHRERVRVRGGRSDAPGGEQRRRSCRIRYSSGPSSLGRSGLRVSSLHRANLHCCLGSGHGGLRVPPFRLPKLHSGARLISFLRPCRQDTLDSIRRPRRRPFACRASCYGLQGGARARL